MGQRYGQRPSEILSIGNERVALDFDIAIAVRGSQIEEQEIEKRKDNQANKKNKIIKEPKPIEGKELEHLRNQFANVKNLQTKAHKG